MSFTLFTTVAVGALSAFAMIVAGDPPSRRAAYFTTGAGVGAAVVSMVYSSVFTVPGGLLAGMIAKRVARARRGRGGLAGWLCVGISCGGLVGPLCFVVPFLLLPPAFQPPFGILGVILTAATGALPGTVTGAIVALYCRRLQRRYRAQRPGGAVRPVA